MTGKKRKKKKKKKKKKEEEEEEKKDFITFHKRFNARRQQFKLTNHGYVIGPMCL